MTHPTEPLRAPRMDRPDPVCAYATEPGPDGSTVLALLTPGEPGVILTHRFALDRYLTRFLMHTLTRDLDGIPDPGPRPEAAVLIDAVRIGDRAAVVVAVDAINRRILNLWTPAGEDT